MKKNYFNRSQIKKISNTKLHFFSQSFVYCAPLSLPETYYQKWRNILLVACTTFPPTFEKTSFQPKMKKKILLIIKQGTRAFWSLWAFHEIKSGFQRLLQSDAVVRRKKNQVFIMLAWFFSEFFLWYSAYLIKNNLLMKYEFC